MPKTWPVSAPEVSLEILPQPDDWTCGPTCLHALYRYYGFPLPLDRLIDEIEQLKGGGTVAVTLANHALRRGFQATLFTYNLQIFDPTWFASERVDLATKLRAQAAFKKGRKRRRVIREYLKFLEQGGLIRYQDLSQSLVERFLVGGTPILTGLSSSYLYGCAREFGNDHDDIRGEPTGHFVVLCSFDPLRRMVGIADPLHPNPLGPSQRYEVGIERLICAILLGTLTYDANLLILEPPYLTELS